MRIVNFLSAAVVLVAASSANADVIAYWAQNDNGLPGGGFGFETTDFPMDADIGDGTWNILPVDASATSGVYDSIQSFSGTSTNAVAPFGSGGSFAFQGDQNNGASVIWAVDASLFSDLSISWAQRGTSTGYTSRALSYSTDGVSFTAIGTDTGALSGSWQTESYDLTGLAGVDGASNLQLQLTFDGASSSSGNNRLDNVLIEGTFIPEPTAGLLVLVGSAFIARRR